MATAAVCPGSSLRMDRQRMKKIDTVWLTLIAFGFFIFVLGLLTALERSLACGG